LQNPLEEVVRYELLIANVERQILYTEDSNVRLRGVLDMLDTASLDLDILSYCLIRILNVAEDIDPAGSILRTEELSERFDRAFDQLLKDSADQFDITSRIFASIARYNIEYALSLADKLNSEHRRDKAYEEIL